MKVGREPNVSHRSYYLRNRLTFSLTTSALPLTWRGPSFKLRFCGRLVVVCGRWCHELSVPTKLHPSRVAVASFGFVSKTILSRRKEHPADNGQLQFSNSDEVSSAAISEVIMC
jgi:hypothetical protein